MKFNEWKPIGLMTLPVAVLAVVPQLLRDPTETLRAQIEGDWYSAQLDGKLSIRRSGNEMMKAVFTDRNGVTASSNLYLRDGTSFNADAKGQWMPNTTMAARVSRDKSSMTLDPSAGSNPNAISTWTPWTVKSGT